MNWIQVGGPFLVSRTGDAGWTESVVKASEFLPHGPQKRSRLVLTAGRWSWRSKSVKKCVTTYPPNQFALKMEEARRETLRLHRRKCYLRFFLLVDRHVENCIWKEEGLTVKSTGFFNSADRSFSSNYTSEFILIVQSCEPKWKRVSGESWWVQIESVLSEFLKQVLQRRLFIWSFFVCMLAKGNWVNILKPKGWR